jgi:hypothetical protein
MELFAGVMGIFVVGLLAYAGAQLRAGVRDLRHAFMVRRREAALSGLDAAGDGPVILRGRARPLKLLSPPAGGTQVVAWIARGSYGFGGDAESAPFVLEVGAEAAAPVRVDARELVLLTSESTDNFGNRLRTLEADAEVTVYGWLERHASGVRLRDVPGHGVVVAAGRHGAVANLARAAGAMFAVCVFAVVVVTAHLP